MRTHFKAILGNTLAELVLIIVGVFASVYLPTEWAPYSHEIVWAIVIVATFPIFIMPFIRWFTTTFTLTTKRIITRHGIFTRTGHDLPLSRISDIQLEKNVDDRLFGCGTLFLQTSADDPLKLDDVPKVEIVQVEISNLLFHDVQGAIDADPTS